MPKPVIIIGGGITGLSAAYYLNKAGIRPTLIEKSPRLGGVIQSASLQGCLVETGPDSFLAAKPAAMELIRNLGLENEVIGSNDHLRVTYVLRHGKLIPLPDGMMMMVPTKVVPLATTRLLSWPAKIRMGLELLRKPHGPAEDRSVESFILDHFGREAVDYLTEPLLSGVFGGDPALLSANSVLTRFVEMESKYGSLARGVLAAKKAHPTGPGGSLFKTLKGGLNQIVDRLIPSADIIQGEAEAIENHRVRVNGDWIAADHIFIAAPAYVAAAVLRPYDAALSDLLNAIPYNSSLTLALGYDTKTYGPPPTGFGLLIPKVERKHLKAATFVNNKFNFRAAPDKILIRCFFGGESLSLSDTELVRIAREELRTLIGLQAEPTFSLVTRWPRSMAQYTVGHARRIEEIKTRMARIDGIEIGGNGYNGIGLPDCIQSGKSAAQFINARAAATP